LNFKNYLSLTTLSNSETNNLQVYHFIIAVDEEKHPRYIVRKLIQTFNGMAKKEIDPNVQWHDKAKGDQIQKLQHI
jgi:hypothetical protein